MPTRTGAATTLAPEPARPANPERRSHRYGPQSPDEATVAIALTTTWMLTTHRRLSQRPALHDLRADQLIDFWADDHVDPLLHKAGNP